MHELSIALALLQQVRTHTPAGTRVTHAHVEAGPLQSIDPDALEFAWQAATQNTDLAHVTLHYRALPWRIICNTCGLHWNSTDALERCPCGGTDTLPAGDDRLRLLSLDIESLSPAPTA